MDCPAANNEQLTQYLRLLAPQVRARLLAELERLHLLGEDLPHAQELIAVLRAEFRNTGQNHYRVGNPSRYFFQPLEAVLVDGAPERANRGQIARGSLGPIWSLVTEKLLPSMADAYVASAKVAIAANNQVEARRLAEAFQNKAVTYLDGMLGSEGGVSTVRSGLEFYTSSHATFDDLQKMLRVMHARQSLDKFAGTLPAKIVALEGDRLAKVLCALDALRETHADMATPFALTLVERRLEVPWQLIFVAARPEIGKTARKVAAMPYAIAVSMVLDLIDRKRLMVIDAIKHNRIRRAKELLTEIHAIDAAIRKYIELDGSAWAKRLDELMAAVDASLDAEINSIPSDHNHLVHTLETFRLRRRSSSPSERIWQLVAQGRDVLTGWLH